MNKITKKIVSNIITPDSTNNYMSGFEYGNKATAKIIDSIFLKNDVKHSKDSFSIIGNLQLEQSIQMLQQIFEIVEKTLSINGEKDYFKTPKERND